MSRRVVLCEGPDDLNALRAIALHLQWATAAPRRAVQGGGQERTAELMVTDTSIRIEIKAVGGKNELARQVAEVLRDLPPQTPDDESRTGILGVVFDPDGEPPDAFHRTIETKTAALGPVWTVTQRGFGLWDAQRGPDERVELRAVHWRAPEEDLDELPNVQNLERVLCAVLAQSFPADKELVEKYLDEIRARCLATSRKEPSWKTAIHLWLALVRQNVDDISAPSRFLQLEAQCKDHIAGVLERAGLLEDLRPLLARG